MMKILLSCKRVVLLSVVLSLFCFACACTDYGDVYIFRYENGSLISSGIDYDIQIDFLIDIDVVTGPLHDDKKEYLEKHKNGTIRHLDGELIKEFMIVARDNLHMIEFYPKWEIVLEVVSTTSSIYYKRPVVGSLPILVLQYEVELTDKNNGDDGSYTTRQRDLVCKVIDDHVFGFEYDTIRLNWHPDESNSKIVSK
ncbi:MAG: hypothetical protein LBK70_03205 [Clostridiales bacterium]|jgi:hypothetical protein|nr:hypothetical protein [Clostridiales bacterium]